MLASVILGQVSTELFDGSRVRWSLADLIGYFNAAQRAVVLVRPDANAVTESVTLAAGAKQALPTNRLRLLKVVRNMGVDGLTAGRSITLTDAESLEAYNLSWTAASQESTIKQYVYDDRVPRVYYVNPPATSSPVVQVEIVASSSPTEIDEESDAIALDDVYEAPLKHYVKHLAYSKSTEAGLKANAQYELAAFYQALGVKLRSDLMTSPNAKEAK